jgi:hypothetical protein
MALGLPEDVLHRGVRAFERAEMAWGGFGRVVCLGWVGALGWFVALEL